MQNEDFRKIYPNHDKEDNEISLLRKRHRGEDVSWTLEEEFLFFEIQIPSLYSLFSKFPITTS